MSNLFTKREEASLRILASLVSRETGDLNTEIAVKRSVAMADLWLAKVKESEPKCPACVQGGTGTRCHLHALYGGGNNLSGEGWETHTPGDPCPINPEEECFIRRRDGHVPDASYSGTHWDWGVTPSGNRNLEITHFKPVYKSS
jgi:hypothetical protein